MTHNPDQRDINLLAGIAMPGLPTDADGITALMDKLNVHPDAYAAVITPARGGEHITRAAQVRELPGWATWRL